MHVDKSFDISVDTNTLLLHVLVISLAKGGSVFGSIGLSVCLSACLSVDNITPKSYELIGMKFYGGEGSCPGLCDIQHGLFADKTKRVLQLVNAWMRLCHSIHTVKT